MKTKLKKRVPSIVRKHARVKASHSRNPFANVRVLEPPANVKRNASVTNDQIDRAIRRLGATAHK
jgi:hypothetical protein